MGTITQTGHFPLNYRDDNGELVTVDVLTLVGEFDPEDGNEYGPPYVHLLSVKTQAAQELLTDPARLSWAVNEHFCRAIDVEPFPAWGASELERHFSHAVITGAPRA